MWILKTLYTLLIDLEASNGQEWCIVLVFCWLCETVNENGCMLVLGMLILHYLIYGGIFFGNFLV